MQVYVSSGVLLGLVGLAACSGGGAKVTPSQIQAQSSMTSATSAAAHTARAQAASSTAASSQISIDVGGGGSGSWIADTDYSGGWLTTISSAVNTNSVSNPAPQAVYQSQRTSATFSYAIPSLTANTSYTVRLHFAELWFSSAGKRLFNVTINGTQVLANFDIFQAAGGSNIAVVKAFTTSADGSGKISLRFAASVDNASVAGIEVIGGSGASVPSPTSTPAPGGSWPAAGWVPYSGGPLTVPVAQNPAYTSDSQSIINTLWNGRSSDAGLLQVYAGSAPSPSYDYTADVLYFGRSSDPVYTVSCYQYGGGCSASGQQVHIPRGAYPAGGSDHHIDIRDTVTGKDLMLWEAPVPSGYGGTYSVGWGAVINSNSQGLNAVGSTASGISAIWSVRETDLQHNTVNHALIVGVNGESSAGYVYPAVGWDKDFFRNNYPKMGAHFWLDVPPSQLPSNCPTYAVSYLTALHKYGAYFVDFAGISHVIGVLAESDMTYTYNGGASVWGPFMQSLGLNSRGMSDLAINNCGISMQNHMHILNPPSP